VHRSCKHAQPQEQNDDQHQNMNITNVTRIALQRTLEPSLTTYCGGLPRRELTRAKTSLTLELFQLFLTLISKILTSPNVNALPENLDAATPSSNSNFRLPIIILSSMENSLSFEILVEKVCSFVVKPEKKLYFPK
jgi:hypothetical protein